VSYARITAALSSACGHPMALVLAILVVLIWAAIGPFVGFSETWQLIINTSTTIVTFLMVFVIQSSQNRDTRALQIKLDELIKINAGASNSLLDLEGRPEAELEKIQKEYTALAQKADEVQLLKRTSAKRTGRRKANVE
jgi:low affinity Fe/Cu permease